MTSSSPTCSEKGSFSNNNSTEVVTFPPDLTDQALPNIQRNPSFHSISAMDNQNLKDIEDLKERVKKLETQIEILINEIRNQNLTSSNLQNPRSLHLNNEAKDRGKRFSLGSIIENHNNLNFSPLPKTPQISPRGKYFLFIFCNFVHFLIIFF